MDPISYEVAAKQKQRIERVIANPDSTSGVVTVPKTIASGETVTVPAGRVAVLPNVQVDGTLNVEGEVFIPSGATMSKVVEKVTSTDNAVVRFNGVTGEVQNSGVIIDDNGNVGIGVTPNSITPGYYTLQMHGSSGLALMSSSNDTHLSTNSYYNLEYRYQTSGVAASDYSQSSGAHYWRTAPTGTAGNAITWTNTMVLDNAGNLRVGPSDTGINSVAFTPSGDIQSANNNVAYTKLKLNPGGGNVLIGTATDDGAYKLQVNGQFKATGYWNQLGDLIVYNHFVVLDAGVTFSLDFTLVGDSSYDVEIIRSAHHTTPQYNRIIFTQMAGIGQYKAISNESACTVTLVSSATGVYRYTVTISSTGSYNGYTVCAKQRHVSINSIS